VHHRTLSCVDFFPSLAKPTVGAPDTVRCTPDSPVPLPTVGTCHASRTDSAADRWPGRLLAHRIVRCTTGQSGDFLVVRRRRSPESSKSQMPACTTGQSGAPRRGLQSTPFKRSKDPLECHGVLLSLLLYPTCEESPQLGASRPYTLKFTKKHGAREG
jgi:hypothetical protein